MTGLPKCIFEVLLSARSSSRTGRPRRAVLTERGLYRRAGKAVDGAAGVDATASVAEVTATVIARMDDARDGGAPPKEKKSPFKVSDFFCVAPLAVFRNELHAGGQRGGSLYRLGK